uniref:transposase n=1 Tax=Burkholderia pseudomallei TaxID=28450 RepID=UPI0035C8A52B
MTKFRLRSEEREHAHYVVYAPRSKATRETLMNVAGRRWEIETGFEAAKGECGLDRYEMRRWQGRYRYITLALNGSCGTRHVAGAQQKNRRLGAAQCAGGPPAPLPHLVARRSLHRVRVVLVGMAVSTPVPRPAVPLPKTGMYALSLLASTAVVLSRINLQRALTSASLPG